MLTDIQIEKMLSALPKKDCDLCKSFLKKRDYHSIADIVDSCIIMKERWDADLDATAKEADCWAKVDLMSLYILKDNINQKIVE